MLVKRLSSAARAAIPAIATMAIAAAAWLSALSPAYAQPGGAVNAAIARCEAGDRAACGEAGMALSDTASPAYDAFLSLRFLQQACAASQAPACGRLALIFFAGEGDVERDLPSAANFAQRACAEQDRDGCEVAEAVFADSASPLFDAEQALRYRRVNCDSGNRQSCIDLAHIYYTFDDYLPAEQIALNACRPADPASADICQFGNQLQARRHKIEAEQQAKKQAALDAQAQRTAVFDAFMQRRDYDGALYYALYRTRSKSQAETAVMAAARAGAMSRIFEDHLYVLEYWFPSGAIAGIVASEMAKRKRGRGNDCGIWNCTNMPGASTRRWQAAGGSRGSGYRSSSGGSSFTPVRVPSSAQIAKQTRDRYRSYNCTGSRRLSSSHPTCQ
ncbi:sel1 repeat family protein [Tsuneonella suprasediminis]|uniref:sel1 repeat family protein n=1 Tax=Tsuneonella suprasediminis TaxID=2306996 RepID=UPI002F939602